MPLDPLQQTCLHLATPGERDRDPNYQACTAAPGEPCTWAARYDGTPDPPFHSERLETASNETTLQSTLDTETFREAILDTGLI